MSRLTNEQKLQYLLQKTNQYGKIVNEELGHCWEWNGAKKEGYGLYSKTTVHRISWEIHNGRSVPKNMVVRHKCDNRCCLNPNHLEIGSVQDNHTDMVSRGRARGGGRRGENATNTKLTVGQVREIRANPHGCTMSCLAHRYQCSISQISRIMHNERWNELDEHETEDALFWKRAIKGKRMVIPELGECWETQRERQLLSYRNHKMLSHRIAYSIENGEIEDGMLVRHKCDNPKCINPEHLELGTHKQNMEDRSKRGRTTKGEAHHSSKLTDKTAMEIYELCGKKSMTEVANEYGIAKQSVSKIWKKKSWKHIHNQTL